MPSRAITSNAPGDTRGKKLCTWTTSGRDVEIMALSRVAEALFRPTCSATLILSLVFRMSELSNNAARTSWPRCLRRLISCLTTVSSPPVSR